MKLKFDSNLDFQDQAIQSVVDIFKGQEVAKSLFTVSAGAYTQRLDRLSSSGVGVGNKLDISEDEILENLNQVQLRNGLLQTKTLVGNDFDVEMETGTGKTYVYTKSMLRLNQEYGFTKFIIVVPSIAIKEGVYKSFKVTEEHFKEIFDNAPYDYFVYNSDKLEQVRNFAVNDCISIMIINIDAFRRSFDDPNDDSKKANIIHRPNDKLNGMKPIDLIKETNPIVIIDEPQSVDTTAKAADAIGSLNPLCIFRYSATHVKKHNMIYRLDAVDSYEKKLVKGIDVAGFSSENQHNDAYIRLISVDNSKSPITAKIEVDAMNKNRTAIERKTITVKKNDDLSEKTKRNVYEGYIVDEIYCGKGDEYIQFSPIDKIVELNNCIGDIDNRIIKEKMISKTIEEHLEKELRYNPQGIKVLSLFFIDRVANYRDNEKKGPYAEMFERCYVRLITKPKYKSILNGQDPLMQAQDAHDGYFSGDKNGWKDSNGKTEKDNDTYNLIMKDKERLLSLNESLRFIFSHSALREGWDNPNVFQICTLNETKSEVKKRQEIGRGLRLCVNQNGERVHDPYVNQLTVMANESYEEFAAKLQNEYEEDGGIRFGILETHTFANIPVIAPDKTVTNLGQDKSAAIYESFTELGYLDKKGKVQDKLKKDLKNGTLIIPEEVESSRSDIESICRKVAGSLNIKNNDDKRAISYRKGTRLDADFKELWDRIKYKTKYNIHFDSEVLIENCDRDLDRKLDVKTPSLVYRKAEVDVTAGGVITKEKDSIPAELIKYEGELPDIITYLQNRTDLTRKTIVAILIGCDKLEDFKKNPQMFMEQSAKIISDNVRRMAIDGIRYERLGNGEAYSQELFENEELFGYLNKNMMECNKSVYDHVVYDSDVERSFAEELENNERVKVYTKLPSWFVVPTPIGDYNPDWAVLMDIDGTQKLYFVIETKGNIGNNRKNEEDKMKCGEKHFESLKTGVQYKRRTSFSGILSGEAIID
ncbi:MAG: DEAD/DEAH box helicase family protein [Candidatus Cloacimonetes bacterium]|nr:DEAD/DEAH box helicase family protein [Candidatus Cloacimonadota bacterium]